MAILAPPDWQYSPRDSQMDKGPTPPASSSSSPPAQQAQRPHQLPPAQLHPQQQQYPFNQQPQGTWTPSLAAPPFYPGAFYQNQQSPPVMPAPPQPYPSPGNPYFDPANAQLAQWAYQQMMFNAAAQQQQQQHQQHQAQHQQMAMGAGAQGDFFTPPPGMHGAFNPFPSGTPPPRQEQPYNSGGGAGAQGFHPYRRPTRQQSSHSDASGPPIQQQQEWRPHQPPYGRPEASGSSSSVNSQGRPRTNSNNSQQGRGSNPNSRGSPSPVPSSKGGSSAGSSSNNNNTAQTSSAAPPRIPHHRNGSSSSTHSAHHAHPPSPSSSGSGPVSPASSSSANSSASKLARPSPLSQGTVTASSMPGPSSLGPGAPRPSLGGSTTSRAERRISRDDSSLALSSLSLLASRAEAGTTGGGAGPPGPGGGHTSTKGGGGGLKGRLRRALSFNASVALREEVGADGDEQEDEEPEDGEGEGEADDHDGGRGSDSDESIKASVVNPGRAAAAAPTPGKPKTPALIRSAVRKPGAAGTFPPPAPSSSFVASASASSSSSAASPSPSMSSPAGANFTTQPVKKKSRAASLFNARFNASTDNISLSSTVSSASVMIRKLGSMGRLARRNSLAGITGLFKDRKKRGEGEEEEGEDGEGGAKEGKEDKKKKGKEDKKKDKDKEKDKERKSKDKGKSGKGEASEASVSHATAELEAGDWSVPDGAAAGLSPAAKLARQHTLKSHAEERAKAARAAAAAQAQAQAQASANANANGMNGGGVPAWERNTATRRGGSGGAVGEDGVFVEESESDEEDAYGGPHQQQQQAQSAYQLEAARRQAQEQQQRWDDEDDEEWGLLGGEEDDTIRVGDAAPGGEDGYGYGEDGYTEEPEHEPWAVDVRRSVERTRVPARGILKHAGTYDQASYLPDAAHPNPLAYRTRSNSYNSPAGERNEPGPLARIPSPDPDHIDGLHRHGSHSSQHGSSHQQDDGGLTRAEKRSSVPSLPPLAFEVGGFDTSPQATPTAATYAQAGVQLAAPVPAPLTGANAIFNHPALNSSAPALTTIGLGHPSGPAPLAHRAATTPAKKLAFASNLSVYDTFSASMYDRRSEPATWSRLTPALAQRIKEELNSYKMEEMEVHAASRIHTQFFV